MVLAEAFERSLDERVRLNRQILENPYWYLSVDYKGHEDFEPVGRGVKSSDYCGKWMGFVVCKNTEGHQGLSVGGVDCTGKVVVRHKHTWCHKATCPVCFIRGWSVRGARSIVGRLEAGVRRGLGKIEHLAVSVPLEEYGLDEKVLRSKSRSALLVRGVVGGCMIFHGFRKDRKRRVLVWSPHYHSLSFVLGGYDRCRHCEHNPEVVGHWDYCKDCNGFEGKTRREFKSDGFIVKVADALEERKNVFGTAWYQLHHATVKVSFLRRFHAVTWFGVCGNRKYASVKLQSDDKCPACGEEMVKCSYRGKRFIARGIGDVDYVPLFVDDEFDESGEPNYVEVVGSLRGG